MRQGPGMWNSGLDMGQGLSKYLWDPKPYVAGAWYVERWFGHGAGALLGVVC